jgi:hypothetical protein
LASDYDICITEISPIFDPSVTPPVAAGASGGAVESGGGTDATDTTDQTSQDTGSTAMLPAYGQAQCSTLAEIELGGQFMVQNNIWNPAAQGQQQCVTALWDQGTTVGFVVDPININVDSSAPGSYPSIVYGWHYGQFHGAYQTAKQISAVGSAPTTWSFTTPSSGSWDASYDLWLHPQGNPGGPEGGLELMIWMAARDTQPIGANQMQTIQVAGDTYQVWYGANEGGWDTVSYVRAGNTNSANFDLMEFVNDAVSRGYAQAGWYLLSVQAGYEPWVVSEPMTTNAFTVSVN